MNQFKCTTCGEMHPMLTLLEFPMPSIIGDISSGKLSQSLHYLEKNVLIVNREYIFILCDFPIKINEYDDDFDMLVWVEISAIEYQTQLKKVKDDK